MSRRSCVLAVAVVFVLLVAAFDKEYAFGRETYRVAWSHYTGWEPWAYAYDSGIMAKWAEKYGIRIELDLINDYVESINLYTIGRYHGCVMTNMDALTIPAAGGIDSTALIIGDFSNGNDGIVLKNGTNVKELTGRKVRLVQLSVSHYLLARALEKNGLSEKELTLVNTSDADIAGLFILDSDSSAAVVTWNPLLMQVCKAHNAKVVFDSSQIPGEIIDLMVVRSNAPDSFKKALVGAWYETMNIMTQGDQKTTEAIRFMAKTAGGTETQFRDQLKTTHMFYEAADAVKFALGPELKKTMDYVRAFCFNYGLFGKTARSKDSIGIAFPDGQIMGDPQNIKLRYDALFMQLAEENKL